MKVTVKIKKEVEVTTLHAICGVRHWEDATVNGIEDVDGDLIPCRDGDDYWKPIIDISEGKIINWTNGAVADIHYKVCDDGSYYLKDLMGETVLSIEGDYVPSIMCPEENGFGDYVIMRVDQDGFIANWKQTAKGFKNKK